jgi:hypothetical protein
MTRLEISKWIKINGPRLQRELSIEDWRIQYDYQDNLHENDGVPQPSPNCVFTMCCNAQEDYQRALITIDPSQINSQKDLRESLRHEMLHICLSPITSFYLAVFYQKSKPSLLNELYIQCAERSVRAVEKILDNKKTRNAK